MSAGIPEHGLSIDSALIAGTDGRSQHVHIIHVFQDRGGPVEFFAPDLSQEGFSCLNMGQAANGEIAKILYTSNVFSLLETNTGRQVALLQHFLQHAGRKNAEYLSHICINFPSIHAGGISEETLQEIGVLLSNCPNVKVLELHVHAEGYDLLCHRLSAGPHDVEQHIADFDARIRRLDLLERVIVRFHTGCATPMLQSAFDRVQWEILPKYASQQTHSICVPLQALNNFNNVYQT